ncbi:molybdenum ABC transporter substrate-binding protein [Heyndrickxia shackletonii]|uniref:Molybdenum ABC transporter substrate-binding protein n=2 Tax=Bacillaceae TaxID=186817 RepID=A0A0Q3TJ08_9BACI|nr:molybdenum ABC transporter substrate-binding protein [Heyndrickxia shackletonii]MBB2478909.1 molybdate ABC transporter substrate-binding protein [Bacillus sp. APMAM]NEY97792.1 molybdate ABC transporter substrate-binding protein [Heyndrickxia shackletonii]RTZ57654.1 molybdate ABC transporter substrate-binding protein [Bacillus sp. SAJ1]
MKKLNLLLFLMMMLLLVISGCSANEQTKTTKVQKKLDQKKVELTISAAASLQDALTDIKADFENVHPNITLNFNFGASGALQQQISQGAPVDLFFSAAKDKFQKLVQDGLIEKKNGTNLVGNDLVLVVPKGSKKGIKTFEDLTKVDKLALGTPESVPAGQYGKETLDKLNVWKALEGKVVYAKDVRQVLTYVETNNVDAGIVYKTDALTSQKVEIAATANDNTHEPIIYPVGVIKNSTHLKEAQLFYKYLRNDKSKKTLEKYGFKDL